MPQSTGAPYEVSSEDLKRLERDYKYHRPTADQAERYTALREMFKQLAFQVLLMCPPSRERDRVLDQLNATNMLANASIARNEPSADDQAELEVQLTAEGANFAPILQGSQS